MSTRSSRALLATVAAVLAFAISAVASAHEYDSAGNTVYVGTSCGGNYLSPFTGHQWFDCFTGREDRQLVTACDGTCAAVMVYREYSHWRDGWNLSYVGWRFVDLEF